MTEPKTMMIFRLEPELKAAFEKMSTDLDLTASQLMRRLMRNAVQQHTKESAQQRLPLAPRMPAEPPERKAETPPAPKKPKKGQRLAAAKPANWKRP